LPLALKVAVRLGFKPPQRMSIAVSAPIPVSKYLSSRYARPLAILSFVGMLALFFPHFAMEPRFDFQDFLPSDSQALETAQGIDSGVGGVAPVYVRIPLSDGVENVTDADFERIQTVHRI